ncbi:SLIT-ROBO Rho GTPase-activating protein 1-like [Limulus polyphemus]|uniref:SLIT-ROBO Rho GTPase-activating protein 1-like n=1 Tax=Limulus polyphemus TaxID=6850 RepID=A0ABM1BTQ5_LIMPO|nr:SLIT-ROBO Rho GTPase-activating protein 1-like [Limulus polyphemus]
MISIKDYDCSLVFSEDSSNRNGLRQPETLALKLRADRQETEDFYLNKFRKYTLDGNLISRLQAKAELIHRAILIENAKSSNGDSPPSTVLRPHTLPHRTKKKRIGQTPVVGQPKLFGGSLEEYLDATNQEIPLIVRSCIRIINLYGLQHQGVFRVSGSQVEINNFKDTFERGEDPLADVTDTGDINSVAGVLKLYLRELREPLFPIFYFDQLVEISQVESKHEFVTKVRDVIASLPRAVFVLLRYLFAFLNHVSEFSDENMMDPYNLATCFGPSLMPIPDDKNQVQYQNLFNELIKNIIIYQDEIFPIDGGIIYEKYISADVPDENDVGESPVDHNLDDPDTLDSYEADILPSEDECEVLEAVAQCSFSGRTDRELSFKEGDTVQLFNQVSSKWWRGSLNGREGLVPDKYIFLKLRDEDKDKLSQDGSEKRRTSSSSDSLSGYSTSPKPSIDAHIPEEGTTGSEFFPPDSLSAFPSSSVSSSLHSPHTHNRRRLSLSPSTLRKVQLAAAGEFDQPKLVHSCSVGEAMEGMVRDENLLGEFYLDDQEGKGLSGLEADLHDMLSSSSHAEIIKEKNILDGSRSHDSLKQNPFSLSKGTPDLVKDLPNNSPSPELPIKICAMEDEDEERPSSRSSIQSCESPELTTAERFAMSHQGTLKKGAVSRISYSGLESTLPAKVWAKTQNITDSLDGSDPSERCSDVSQVTNETKDQIEQDFVKSPPEVPCKPVYLKQDLEMPKNSAIDQSPQVLYAKGISNFKPPTKIKPPVMKKPTNPLSLEPVKFQQKEYKQTSC